MITITMKDLKQMNDVELILRIINEKRQKLHPYSPLGERIDRVGKALKQNAHQKGILIRALKTIRASQESDLAEYAVFCENTAKEALREVGL